MGAGALCLVPSEASLFGFYSRLGFQTCFGKKIVVLRRNALEMIAQEERCLPAASNESIAEIRARALAHTDAFLWDAPAVAYAVDEALFNGMLVAAGGASDCYAFIEIKGDTAVAREALCLPGALPSLASLMLRMSGASEFRLHLPVSFPLSADNCNEVPNGMMLDLDGIKAALPPGGAYIGLTLE